MTILLYDLVGRDAKRPFSPHCWKAAMSLAHKGLDFESVPTPFTAVGAVEGSVSKIVPVIRDGETVVADSFAIAVYLDETYPDRPSLFGGEGGKALSRFVESWTMTVVHDYLGMAVLVDVHGCLDTADQAYFRESREARIGKKLEEAPLGREERLAGFLKSLDPLRMMLKRQPFLGGETPLFADYIVFGAFQWARIVSPMAVLPAGDPVHDLFERCLDLHDGLGRSVAAAA